VNVTVSLGVAFATLGESPDAVLKRADEALYQSKKKGRNRVSKSLPPKNS
jgi:diguanylate cyclase (GGDEF)-like protein